MPSFETGEESGYRKAFSREQMCLVCEAVVFNQWREGWRGMI